LSLEDQLDMSPRKISPPLTTPRGLCDWNVAKAQQLPLAPDPVMSVDTEKPVGRRPAPLSDPIGEDACGLSAPFGVCRAHPQAGPVVKNRPATTTSASSAAAATANLPCGVESFARIERIAIV
jgi:hypothetical protein